MRVILFQERFSSQVLTEDKLQTIRKKARCKPGDVLSLRIWTGKPYRSQQWEMHKRICRKVTPVKLYFRKDGKFIVERDGREVRDRDKFAKADGFTGFDDMVAWFLKTHGAETFEGELITWHKGKSPKEKEPEPSPTSTLREQHRSFQFPKSKRFGYVIAVLKVDHAHWVNDYDSDPEQSEAWLNEIEAACNALVESEAA